MEAGIIKSEESSVSDIIVLPMTENYEYVYKVANLLRENNINVLGFKYDIEIAALSVEDGIKSVADFKADNDYSFIMGVDLNQGIFKGFLTYFGNVSTGSYSIPGTVFIDKYGFSTKAETSLDLIVFPLEFFLVQIISIDSISTNFTSE